LVVVTGKELQIVKCKMRNEKCKMKNKGGKGGRSKIFTTPSEKRVASGIRSDEQFLELERSCYALPSPRSLKPPCR
jgi:hypothetical protein